MSFFTKNPNGQMMTPSSSSPTRTTHTQSPSMIVTGTSGKQYSLDNNTVNWIKSRYKNDMANSYGLDDADQLAKRNGQLSASALKTYKNSNVDRQLAELGLPSEKNLEKYLESYNQWHTGGMDQYFGQSNLPKNYWTTVKGWYQSDMQNAYENTAEDQQRKARGLMPSKWESKYTDTEIDDQLRARGLPPISEYNTYRDRYNNYLGIENFYANVAYNETNLRLAGIKDDDTAQTYGGEEKTGHDFYVEAFFNELNKKNDDGSYVYAPIRSMFKNGAKPSTSAPTGDYAYDLGADITAENKNAASDEDYANYNAISYDDYKKHYDDLYNRYFANQKTGSGQLVSDALAVQARDADAEATKQYYDVDNSWFGEAKKGMKQLVDQYQQDYPQNTLYDMFSDMLKNGVSLMNVRKAARALQGEAKTNGAFNEISKALTKAENDWAHTEELDALYGANGYDVVEGRVIPKGATPVEGVAAPEPAADTKTFFNFGDAYTNAAKGYDASAEPAKVEQHATNRALASEQVDEDLLKQTKDAIDIYHSAVAAYEETAGHGAPSAASREPIDKANALLNELGYKSIHSAERYVESVEQTKQADEQLKKDVETAIRELDDAKINASLKGDSKSLQAVVDAEKKVASLLGVSSAGEADAWLRTGELPVGEASFNGTAVTVDNAIKVVETYMEQNGGWNAKVAEQAFSELYRIGVSPDIIAQAATEMQDRFGEMEESFTEPETPDAPDVNSMREYVEANKDRGSDEATVNDTKKALERLLFDEEGNNIVLTNADGVINAIDAVREMPFTTPASVDLALKDLGFSANGWFSGVAEDLTNGWSTDEMVNLRLALGRERAVDVDPEDNLPDDAKFVRDTFGLSDFWTGDPVSSSQKILRQDDFASALEWANQQIADGTLTAGQAYNILAEDGYHDELEILMGDEWHKAHFKEYVAPGLWNMSKEEDRLLWDEMSEAERDAATEMMWDNLSDEDKAAKYGDPSWWKYDPTVKRTAKQAWGQQAAAMLPGFISQLISTPVTIADSVDALITGRPEIWGFTDKLNNIQNAVSSYGSVDEFSLGTRSAEWITSAAQELLKMETLGNVGNLAGEIFSGTGVGSKIIKSAASNSKVVSKAASFVMGMIKASPYVAESYADHYIEAKLRGATNGEAAFYGLTLGGAEGAFEWVNFDKLWGKALGSDKLVKEIIQGGLDYANMGINGKLLLSSLALSSAGEATEEFAGYNLETLEKLALFSGNGLGEKLGLTPWANGTEYSLREGLEQALVGGLIGLLGAGLHSGSLTTRHLIMDYAIDNGDAETFRKVAPDIAYSIGIAEGLSKADLDMYKQGGANIMSSTAYGEKLTQMANLDAGIENAGKKLEKTKANLQLKLENQLREIDQKAAKGLGVNLDAKKGSSLKESLDVLTKKCNELGVDIHDIDLAKFLSGGMTEQESEATKSLLSQRSQEAVQRNKDAVRKAYDNAVADEEAQYKTNVEQNKNLYADLANQVQEHWVGIYLQNYNGIISGMTDEMVSNLAKAYQNGAKYDPQVAAEQAAKRAETAQTKRSEAEAAETIEEAKETAEPPENAAAEQPAAIRKLTDDEVAKVQQAAKDLKYKGDVVFIDDPNEADAWIDDNGTITINRANISDAEAKELADNPGWWLLKHEFTHFTEGTAEYDAYASAVQDILKRRFGDNYGRVLDAIKQDYAQRGRTLDDTGVVRELVAKFSQSGDILNNAETINAFVREQGTVADRIYNWIRYKINDLKLRRKPNSAVARELLKAERLYAQAYRAANRKAPSYNGNQLATGRSLDSIAKEYVGVANPRTGVTAEEDAEYMRAALAGDTETTGRMVRDMYERNGLMHVYRGEPQATGSWTEVNMGKFKGPGMFAATDIDTARAAEYTQSYAREDLKTKPLSYGDAMPVLQQFADSVAQRIGRGTSLVADSYYMDDEGNEYAEDGQGREHYWALRDGNTGEIFADSTELAKLTDAAKRKAARIIGGNPQNIYNSINDPFAGRILDLYVKFNNANEHNANGDEWDQIQMNAPKGVTLYRIEVTNDPDNESATTITAYPIDESFDAESSSASERGTKAITFESEDDMDYMYKLERAFKDLFGKKSDISDFFIENAEWSEDGATLDKVGVYDKNGRTVRPEDFPDAETTSTDELALRDKEAGYDGSIIRNVRDGGQRATTDTVSFNPNYIKSADAITYDDNGNIIPLSQRGDFSRNELRYSTGRSLNDLLNEYGAIEPGREPRARDVQVPKQTNDQNRVSQWIRSLVESGKLTDDQAQNVLQMVVEQDYGTYVPTSQAERMEEARAYIAERQPLQAQQEFHDMVMQGKFGVKTNALGIQLLSDASARGDFASVLDIASDLQLAATEAGQSAQIFNVLKELKGVGSAWYMQKVIDRMNSKYADKIKSGKMQRITVDPALMAQLAQATTVDQIAAAEEAVAKDIARQLPLTWDDRLSSWRYFSMLANPTTHIRNITGNLLMKGLNTAKDAVATGLENVLGVDESERAHAILTAADKSTWGNWVQQSYEEQARNLSGGSKLGFESFVKQNMRSFDTKFLNALAQFNFKALENEDIAFIKPAYKNALMQYMKAQGYTLNEKGQAGKVDAKGQFHEMTKAQMNEAIDWASQQAWKQTFRDASSLATMLNKLSKENAVSRLLVEGVMPFKKTPINIARRGVDYSPAGIIKGIAQLTSGVKKGKVTTAQAIDTLSSGLTGSALMALGVMLAKLGVIRAGGEKDKKLETFLEDTGDQTYAVKFGDKSINMSSIAPATIPLFMGVALNEMIEQGGDSLDLSTITDTIAGTLNPFMEMSFMSSLNSALKNYNTNGIGGALGSTLMTAAQNYGSQYLPTLGGKIAQFLDPTRRTTKSDATSPVGGNMDYYGRSLMKKVPGLESTLQPDVDVWGRTDTKDSFSEWAWDFANKFILPTTVKVTNRDAVDNELIRVVESTGVTDFLPSDGNKYFTVNKQKYTMNAKQYTQYSQERGQAAYVALKDVMASASYKTASDEQKATMLKKAIDAAYKQVNNSWKEKLGAYDNK